MVGLIEGMRNGGAGDGERARKLVSERILDNLNVRDGGGVGGTGWVVRAVDLARGRVRVGEGGANGDERDR